MLPTYVNGFGPFAFILDTGASHCLVATDVAAAVGISGSAEHRAIGTAGEVVLLASVAEHIRVADTTIANVPIGVTDELTRIGAAIGSRVDGAIGYEFLRHTCTTVNYPAQTIAFSDRPAHSATAPAVDVAMRLASARKPLVLLDAFLDDRGPYTFAVDTGASASVISLAVAQELQLQLTPIPQITGGGGTSEAAAGVLRSLRIESEVTDNLPVVATGALEVIAKAIERPLHGVLGYNFLRRYCVVFDYVGERFTLLRRELD